MGKIAGADVKMGAGEVQQSQVLTPDKSPKAPILKEAADQPALRSHAPAVRVED